MSNRLTRITTGKGDGGSTQLADGTQVAKSSFRIDAIGAVDELNAAIGLFVAALRPLADRADHSESTTDVDTVLRFSAQVQNELFNVGGELASPNSHYLSESAVNGIEAFVHKYNESLPPLQEFVIPGQNIVSAHAHHARCVARRAERDVVRLHEEEAVSSELLVYLNRLSDAFFIIARITGRVTSKEEPQWDRTPSAKEDIL